MNHPTHPPNFWSTGHHHPTTPADPLAGVKLFPWSKPMSNATAKCPNHDSESEGQILASTHPFQTTFFGSLGGSKKSLFKKINARNPTTDNSIQLIGSPKRTVVTWSPNFCQHTRSPSAFPPELEATVSRRQRQTPQRSSNWIISPGRDEDKRSTLKPKPTSNHYLCFPAEVLMCILLIYST